MSLLGLSLGATFTIATVLVVEAVDAGDTGLSAGLSTVTRLLGGVLGAQLAATLIAGGATFSLVYALAAVAVVPPLCLMLTSTREPATTRPVGWSDTFR